jgi:hypothetical protein
MADGFIIMQIGNAELDRVCADCIVPALEACALAAKRVDKHNKGGLLKSEIIGFIESAQIIVADLTNARPNCYLEVGYAMGLDKFSNLVLTAREDHYVGSPNHKPGITPTIHFDLSGYDILFWSPDHLDVFRSELEKRIKRRLAVIEPAGAPRASVWDSEWIEAQQGRALEGIRAQNLGAYMEVIFALAQPKGNWTQKTLDEAVRAANIHTFGWPIAAHLTKEPYRPRPQADGIVAEIAAPDRSTYDYWRLRRNGDFYLLQSLFEDTREPKQIFFDTRIVRVAEALLFCARLYNRLGVDPTTTVGIKIAHAGFQGRSLMAASPNRMMIRGSPASDKHSDAEVQTTLSSIDGRLVELVKEVCAPLFLLFDFSEFSDEIYGQIVNGFVNGKVGA